jgi:glycerol-3-phosphate acyltransferase PlsY
MCLALLFIIAYLAGSLNVPIGLFRLSGREDPRTHFSGNPGMTNVYRQAGLWWALVVLILEMGKAMIIAAAALKLLPLALVPWIGFGLIIGNLYPCFHRFQGGKGIANFLGFSILIAPMSAGVSMLLWPMVYLITRQPFIGSFIMVGLLSTGIINHCGTDTITLIGTAASAILVYYAHKQNVMELLTRKGFINGNQ